MTNRKRVRQDNLPKPAMNLARRARSIAQKGDGTYHLTLHIRDGAWVLQVGGSDKMEQLGGGCTR